MSWVRIHAARQRAAGYRQLWKVAIVVGGVAVALLMALRFSHELFGRGVEHPTILRILDTLIGSSLSSAAIAAFLWFFRPDMGAPLDDSAFPANQIDSLLLAHAHIAADWKYVGHTGRYTRAKIFPVLQDRTRSGGARIRVEITLLDPNSKATVEHYARYRSSARGGTSAANEWTSAHVRKELLATALCTAELATNPIAFQVELRLSNHVNVLRFDAGDGLIVVSEEDPRRPAFKYDRADPTFELFDRMMSMATAQARLVTLPSSSHILGRGQMAKEMARQVADAIASGDKYSDTDVEQALALYRDRKSPY